MLDRIFSRNKKSPKTVEDVSAELRLLEEKYNKTAQELEELKKEFEGAVQKVGIVRFNPFVSSKVGGDQSFAISLLDKNDNGIVVSCLYTSEGNRVYAKPIIRGKSSYQLSEEEKQAMRQALKIEETKNDDKR